MAGRRGEGGGRERRSDETFQSFPADLNGILSCQDSAEDSIGLFHDKV